MVLEFTTYCSAQIIYTFYRHRREMCEHLGSFGAELNQSQFFQLFALGCFDSFITLPVTVTGLVTNIIQHDPKFKFYQGWTFVHSDWEQQLIPNSVWSADKWSTSSVYWDEWINPFFALAIFALFGLTPGARKGYRRFFCYLSRPFGANQAESTGEASSDIVFQSGRGTNATILSNLSNG